MIGERRSTILGLIIDHYIKTGEPMGSKTLCLLLPYSISSATIRNEMAYLSDIGFLEQRHTSGGRIPTKASYRYYVDNLLKPKPVTPFEQQKINEILSVNASDPERLLADGARLLADVTGCASFYSTVKDPLDCIQGIDLIPAGNQRAMLVMLSVGGKIKSSVCKITRPIDDDFKRMFYLIINEYFIGTPLADVNLSLVQSTAPRLGTAVFDMLPVLTSLCSLCSEASQGSLEIYGETNLLSQDELSGDVYKLLSFLAQRSKLEQLLDRISKGTIPSALFLGDENPVYELRNTAMALGKLEFNESQKATLGIIGSLRIDYETVLPRVDYIINTVSQLLKEGGVRYE